MCALLVDVYKVDSTIEIVVFDSATLDVVYRYLAVVAVVDNDRSVFYAYHVCEFFYLCNRAVASAVSVDA